MTDLQQLLRTAATQDEPVLGFTADQLVTAGSRAEHRRAAVVAGVGLAAVASTALAATTTLPALTPDGTASAVPIASDGASTRPTLSSDDLGLRSSEDARRFLHDVLMPVFGKYGGELSTFAIDSYSPGFTHLGLAGHYADSEGWTYVYLTFAPAGQLTFPPPSCAEMSDEGANGDGYVGPCTQTTREDGSVLIERSGVHPVNGGKTQAMLVYADGSGVSLENTNQQGDSSLTLVDEHGREVPQPLRAEPALTSAELVQIVTELDEEWRDYGKTDAERYAT